VEEVEEAVRAVAPVLVDAGEEYQSTGIRVFQDLEMYRESRTVF
jgi:hypothetical protein